MPAMTHPIESSVVTSLLSNAVALGLVYIMSTIFITDIMRAHDRQWYAYALTFLIAARIAILVYTSVYLMFG